MAALSPSPEALNPGFLRELSGQLPGRDPAGALEIAQNLLRGGLLDEARGTALLLSGQALYRMGELPAAREALGEALGLLALNNSLRTEAGQTLGRIHRDLGEPEAALRALDEAMHSARNQGDAKAEAEILNLRAGIHADLGEVGQALKGLEAALALSRGLGLTVLESNILTNLGRIYRELPDNPRALEHLLSAFRIHQTSAADARSQGSNLLQIGQVYEEMGDLTQAESFFGKALKLGQEAEDRHLETASLNNLANARRAQGDLEAARDFFSQALASARRFEMRGFEADNLDGLGQVYAERGELGQAVETFRSGLLAAQAADDPEGELEIQLHLARALLGQNALTEARSVLGRTLELAKSLERKRFHSEAHELLSGLAEAEGDYRAALAHLQVAHRLGQEAVSQDGERRVRQLAVQFDLERAHTEAEMYRIRTEVEQEARLRAEAEVRQRTADLEASQQEVVNRLALASEYRDDSTGEHIRRVGQIAGRIAGALGWSQADVDLITTAARLHDVGKIGIPDAILLKPASLSASEFALMREHAAIGGEILSGGKTRLLKLAHEIALSHHERWDGQGYPRGLGGQAIPLSARIVSVADALDALTHERPYKQAWPLEKALEEIGRQSGLQFDPQVVRACLKIFDEDREDLSRIIGKV